MTKVKLTCDVFVEDPPVVDVNVFLLWVRGEDLETAKQLVAQSSSPPNTLLQHRWVLDQYRNFELLKEFLHSPQYLASNSIFQLHPKVRATLIEKYYSFDNDLAKELFGKKLQLSKMKSTLEDFAEKTKIKYNSCKRQLLNFRRVYKAIEKENGNPLLSSIMSQFLISEDLAGKYLSFCFASFHRLKIQKKKFPHPYNLLNDLMSTVMRYWCPKEISSLTLDTAFVSNIRDLKPLLLSDREVLDQYKARVMKKLPEGEKAKAEKNLGTIIKNILGFGAGLGQPKDLVEDLGEKIFDPLKQLETKQPSVLFKALKEALEEILEQKRYHHRNLLMATWRAFLDCLQECFNLFYFSST